MELNNLVLPKNASMSFNMDGKLVLRVSLTIKRGTEDIIHHVTNYNNVQVCCGKKRSVIYYVQVLRHTDKNDIKMKYFEMIKVLSIVSREMKVFILNGELRDLKGYKAKGPTVLGRIEID